MTPTQSDEELKPCPFCGGEVLYINPNEGGGQRVSMTYPRYPYCETCRQGFDFGTRSESRIIQKWNTRHAEQELEAVKREYFEKGKRDLVGALEELSLEHLKALKSKQAQGGE